MQLPDLIKAYQQQIKTYSLAEVLHEALEESPATAKKLGIEEVQRFDDTSNKYYGGQKSVIFKFKDKYYKARLSYDSDGESEFEDSVEEVFPKERIVLEFK